jgi:hypothetical protein
MGATSFQRQRREAAKAASADKLAVIEDAPEVDLAALREEYTEAMGKKPFHGWDADKLTAKIEAAE